MKLAHFFLAASISGILTACATQSSPEGGPKDETNPKLVKSNPDQGELNVRTQVITMLFDEEVQPNKLNTELLVTPNVDNKYTVFSKRERLEIRFENQLEANTTYTLNFRNGIQDITEKNPALDLKITFSTGTFLDSSRVSGKIMRLLTQQPESEAIVALYPVTDSVNIRKNPPYYQANTNEAGEFVFENIKEGEYRIFALVDKNNNNFYDTEAERIGYLPNTITITPETDTLLIQTITIDTKKPMPPRREMFQDRVILTYNEGLSYFRGSPVDNPTDSVLFKMKEDGKIVNIFTGNGFTGGRTILTALDSAGNRTVDTLQLTFEGRRSQTLRGAVLKTRQGTPGTYRRGQPVTIELQTPVNITGPQPITLIADTIVVHTLKYPEEITLDPTATELTFNLPNTDNKITQLLVRLDSTTIVPKQGAPLTYPTLTISKADEKGTGSIRGSVVSKYTSYIIQLLNKDGKVVEEQKNQKTYNFRSLEPGTYTIRVLIDTDNDGKWRGGDPKFVLLPEPVYIHPKPIEIRANWDITDEKLEF